MRRLFHLPFVPLVAYLSIQPYQPDPARQPLRGEGADDRLYEWMIGFNRWLAQKDSFVASEMRIKVRYLSFTIDTDRLKLVWGAPEDLLRTFEAKREVVLEQLVVAANRLSPPLSPHPLSPQKKIEALVCPDHSRL